MPLKAPTGTRTHVGGRRQINLSPFVIILHRQRVNLRQSRKLVPHESARRFPINPTLIILIGSPHLNQRCRVILSAINHKLGIRNVQLVISNNLLNRPPRHTATGIPLDKITQLEFVRFSTGRPFTQILGILSLSNRQRLINRPLLSVMATHNLAILLHSRPTRATLRRIRNVIRH